MTLKRLITVLILIAFILMMSSCGSSNQQSSNGTQSLTSGNWFVVATSATLNNSVRQYTFLRGELAQSNNTLAATMGFTEQFSNMPCYKSQGTPFANTLLVADLVEAKA